MGLVMDIPRKRGNAHQKSRGGNEGRGGWRRENSLPRTLRASQNVHIVLQAVKKMGYTSGCVYASGLIVLSPTVLCHNTIGYSSVYIPRLQSMLETSTQTSWSAVVDYGDARRVSNPEARDIEHTAGEG